MKSIFPFFFLLVFQISFAQTEPIKETCIPADSLLSTGVNYYNKKVIDSAIHYLLLSLNNTSTLDDNNKKQAYQFLTRSYRLQGEHENALVYGQKLLEHAQKLRDTSTVEFARYSLAIAYENLGNITEALHYYKIAAETALSINDYRSVAISYNAICTIYGNQNEADKGLPFGKLALEYVKKTGDIFHKGRVLCVLAGTYYGVKDYENSVEAYKKAMNCFQEIENEQFYKIAESGLLYVQEKMGNKEAILSQAKKEETKELLTTGMDSLTVQGSYQDLKLKLLTADVNLSDKSLKFDTLQEDYFRKQATALKQKIWFISALSLFLIMILILLYNRQRQKAKIEIINRLSEQTKNEYLLLQKESEQKMIRKYVEGLENERERISKELHDGICNDLLSLEMEFKNSFSGKKEIQKQMRFLEQTRENIRNISHELMPPQFQYATIDEILKDYIFQYNTSDKCFITYHCNNQLNLEGLPKEMAFEIYRIVQETIGNAIKHAQANQIDLKLDKTETGIQITTSDNGKGFAKTKKYGYTINERVKSLNGKIDVVSGDTGTSVKIAFNL